MRAALASALLLTACASVPPAPAPTPRATTANEPWWTRAIFYEVFVRSFADSDGDGIGDFDGLTAHLDDLAALGVDALWLMPIHPSPSYHGYDVTDYRGVNPQYGGPEAFARFLAAAEAKGIRVIVDFVLNHSSSEHPWFLDAKTGPKAEHRDWYVWRDAIPSNGFKRPWDGANCWHEANGSYYYGLFWSGMPDVNLANPVVEAEMIASMGYWLDLGLDGFRVDAARYFIETDDGVVADTAETHALSRRVNAALTKAHPKTLLVAEAWTALEDVAPYYGNDGDEFHLAFGFDLASAIKAAVKDGNRADLNQVLAREKKAYATPAFAAPFLSNHDMARVMRSFDGDAKDMRVAAAVLFAMAGTPFLYYGEEIGMQGGADPKDEDKRTPMRWTSDAGHGFTKGEPWHDASEAAGVDVKSQREDPKSLWNLYRELISVRRANDALAVGDIASLDAPGAGRGVIALLRTVGSSRALFVANLHDEVSSPFELELGGELEALYGEGVGELVRGGDRIAVGALPGKSFGYYALR